MRRTYLFCALVALSLLIALQIWRTSGAHADRGGPVEAARSKLPLTRVVLFNTGLGYFQREGTVEGDARVDLSIPAASINDMLKTLLIDNGGKPAAISYDGAEPIDQSLRSFAVDLSTNPTLGQLLNQARGEKVEVALEGGGGLAAPVTGTIVGMEAEFENQVREVHHLNVLCSDGVRRLPLARVQRVRFLNPAVEDEFRRALAVLAGGRSEQRRLVSLTLSGEGERKVKVAHVAETPIWKACYRLVLAEGKVKKSALQGWAVIQNTTEEDWRNVRVVLVSGRPITFRMDLGQPLYMPRPTVEPAVYASLRPPLSQEALPGAAPPGGGLQLGLQLGGFQIGGQPGGHPGAPPGRGNGDLGVGGGLTGGQPLVGPGGQFNRYQPLPGTSPSRLSYEELLERRKEMLENRAVSKAKEIGGSLADLGEGIDDVVTTADTIGEGFRYSLKSNVNLPRQKSALLPTLDAPIEVKRLSVYNPAVHPRFPLQSVRLKNTSGQHLMQGPVAVYDGGAYLGDSRMLDLPPGQERLLSFAMDLGVEVRPTVTPSTGDLSKLRLFKGVLWVSQPARRTTEYTLRNRSKTERLVSVEHANSGWSLGDGEKPVATTPDYHRFEWKVAPGRTVKRSVEETNVQTTALSLAEPGKVTDEGLRFYMRHAAASKGVKEALGKVLAGRQKLAGLRAEVVKLTAQLRAVTADQGRLRANLDKAPDGSATQKRFLEKLEEQEKQIEKLQAQLAEKTAAQAEEVSEQAAYLAGLTVS
jgi:hypothetical protein